MLEATTKKGAKQMIIISVDPGLVAGVSVYDSLWSIPQSEEIKGRENFYDWLLEKFANYAKVELEVVCESYHITNRTGQLSPQYDALFEIGAIELLCHSDNRKLFMQSPATKGFGSNRKLQALGWWAPSSGGHMNDSRRHLLRHLVHTHKDQHLINALAAVL